MDQPDVLQLLHEILSAEGAAVLVVSFLAVLELARERLIEVTQAEHRRLLESFMKAASSGDRTAIKAHWNAICQAHHEKYLARRKAAGPGSDSYRHSTRTISSEGSARTSVSRRRRDRTASAQTRRPIDSSQVRSDERPSNRCSDPNARR